MKKSEDAAVSAGEAVEAGRAVGLLLRSLFHTLRHCMDEAQRQHGSDLSFTHFGVLFNLSAEPGITGAQLARRSLVSAQSMNAIVHLLERDGLIVRGPHPESRSADSWRLTAAGETQLARARAIGDTVFARMLAPLSGAEIEQLQTALRRCVDALGADDGRAERRSPAVAPAQPASGLRA